MEPLGECLWNFVPMKYSWFSAQFNVIPNLFGRMCHQWWSHLFLIGSLTSIQLLLGFQRQFAERKYSACLKSCVCFSCCSVYKDDRPGFWLADTLSDSLQPEAYNLHASSNNFFLNAIFVSIYLPIVPILWAINIIQAHQDPFPVYIYFFHKSTSPKVLAWIVIGRSGDFLFVDQSNFFLNDYADRQPSSRNTHQEYSFHLYSGGTSPPK